nr:ribulokinase [Rhizobium sp.]
KPVVAPQAEEPVLLGSAILGAVASGAFTDMRLAMEACSAVSAVYPPAEGTIAAVHARRFRAFEGLQTQARSL